MTVESLSGVINANGVVTFTISVLPANVNEALFLGYACGEATSGNVTALATTLAPLANTLGVVIPAF